MRFTEWAGDDSTIEWEHRYCGRLIDIATQLYSFRRRYFNSALGAFLSPDPSGFVTDVNLYRYCRNNPINSLDPTGLFTLSHGKEESIKRDCGQVFQTLRDLAIEFEGEEGKDFVSGWLIQWLRVAVTVEDCCGLIFDNTKRDPMTGKKLSGETQNIKDEYLEAWRVVIENGKPVVKSLKGEVAFDTYATADEGSGRCGTIRMNGFSVLIKDGDVDLDPSKWEKSEGEPAHGLPISRNAKLIDAVAAKRPN